MNRLFALLLCLGAATGALARTHTVWPAQYLISPDSSYEFFGRATAIDADSIITVADRAGGRVALLYRRNASGQWTFSRTLLDVSGAPEELRDGLAMKNGIAAVQLNGTVAIFERVAGNWVRAATAAPAVHPGGLAISGTRILIGGNRCDYDAVVYQKGTNGVWSITATINDNEGTCSSNGVAVELNYDYAMLRQPDNLVRVYRASGTDWPQVGSFLIPDDGGPTSPFSPVALQKSTVVLPGSVALRRTGSSWNRIGQLQPVDYGNGSGHTGRVIYRDGVILATETWNELHSYTKVYAYHENVDGSFDHAAILETPGWTDDFDVSGNTVVVGAEDFGGERNLTVYTLPSPIVPPAAIANDFNAHDASGFETNAGSQFALAGNVYNYLYRQSATTGESIAVLTDSDWNFYQSIEADVTPTAFDGADRYVGLAVRYQDASNNYYVTWRSTNVIQLKRKVNGAFVTLAERPLALTLNTRHQLRLSIAGTTLAVHVDGNQMLQVNDTTFTHGRAALLTYRARADFDNVYASTTDSINLNYNDWVFYWYGFGRRFTELGGNWQITGEDDPEGMSQTTTTGLALATNGVATDDQEVRAHIRLETFAGSTSGAWFGLLARYVDESNYYYLSIRSSNQLQIRKVVNGATTVLKAVAFTAAPGAMREYTLSVRGNELHALVDGQLVATALDDALPRGKFGMGTYRAAATWQDLEVTQ